MEVIPAIDIRGGRCVRLYQGDYARETVFSDDPLLVAERWQKEGAQRLHVVDLDGAREGEPVNDAVIGRILKAANVPVQVAGGIRQIDVIDRYMELGADRVVVGTAAVKDEVLVANACALYREALVVSVDARGGRVATEGWREGSSETAEGLARRMAAIGVQRFVFTDIGRDGTMRGPNFSAIARLVKAVGVPVIAAGGIASIDHVRRLAKTGVEAVILGRALYDGSVSLPEALGVAQ